MAIAGLLERLPNPPVTRAMLGVLDHDDQVDAHTAASALGLELTPLQDMLVRCVKDAGR
jgi:NADPH-dependent ferric siderophore reductase